MAAARTLQARHGSLAVLVKRGAAGCTLVEAGGGREPLRQAAFAVDKVAPWSGAPVSPAGLIALPVSLQSGARREASTGVQADAAYQQVHVQLLLAAWPCTCATMRLLGRWLTGALGSTSAVPMY